VLAGQEESEELAVPVSLCVIFDTFGSTRVSCGVLVMLVAKDVASQNSERWQDVQEIIFRN